MKITNIKSLILITTLAIASFASPAFAKNKKAEPIVSVSAASIVESDEGVGYLKFEVSLSTMPNRAVVVFYNTKELTASSGADFQETKGKLVFTPSKKDMITKKVIVPIIGDLESELNETFEINITKIMHGTQEVALPERLFATAFIIDNDNLTALRTD